MCWSLSVSVGSYAIVCVLAASLFYRNWSTDRWFALWLLFVGQIQLCEVALWADQDCGLLHRAANVVLLGVISLEPLVHCMIAHACTPPKLRSGQMLQTLAHMSALFAAVLWAVSLSGVESWCSYPCGAEGHLKWPWVANLNVFPRFTFLLLICAPFAAMRPASHGAAGAAFTAGLFAISYALSHTTTTFESMWCWLAVFGFAVPFALNRRPLPHVTPAAPAVTAKVA